MAWPNFDSTFDENFDHNYKTRFKNGFQYPKHCLGFVKRAPR